MRCYCFITMARKTLYSEKRVGIICKAIADGETKKIACARAGISEDTFANWMKHNSDFSARIKTAEDEYNKWYSQGLIKDSLRSLKTLIIGTEYEETRTEYEDDPKNPGQPIIKRQTVTTKRVLPNVTAIIFALTNRDPENWKNRQTTDVNANVKSDNVVKPDLSAIPDELLEQVLNKINGGE